MNKLISTLSIVIIPLFFVSQEVIWHEDFESHPDATDIITLTSGLQGWGTNNTGLTVTNPGMGARWGDMAVITSARRPSPVRHPATWLGWFPRGRMDSAAVPDGENGGQGAALMVAEGPNGYLKGNQFRYNSYVTISFVS